MTALLTFFSSGRNWMLILSVAGMLFLQWSMNNYREKLEAQVMADVATEVVVDERQAFSIVSERESNDESTMKEWVKDVEETGTNTTALPSTQRERLLRVQEYAETSG